MANNQQPNWSQLARLLRFLGDGNEKRSQLELDQALGIKHQLEKINPQRFELEFGSREELPQGNELQRAKERGN